eukprot:6976960-Pyramimonas_sp.AAC.1
MVPDRLGIRFAKSTSVASSSCLAATAELSPLSKAAGGPSGVRHRADLSEPSPSLGGCDLQNCRHLRGLLVGLAEWGTAQI